jgi:predicted Zn finger-like uncharacterized protein
MKISCQSCQAKYTIADEKVLGKVVKIRCKKCGETIVVNGSAGGEAVAASAYPVPQDASSGGGNDAEAWTINVAEGDQRTMSEAEVASAYHAGVVNDDTYCWRDGMADWRPLRDIDSLYEACNSTRAMTAPSELQRPPQAAHAAGGNGASAHQTPLAASSALAARRSGGRSPGSDLFGTAAQAGGEDDVMTSAPAAMPHASASTEPEKRVGERNENSVLFSLAALTSKDPAGPPKPAAPGVEASGLIDIQQLSAQLQSVSEKKKSSIDDIMNLTGGGAFTPALTAPALLTAPAAADYSGPGGASGGKSRGLIYLALAGGALVVVAAIGATTMLMHPQGEATAGKPVAGSAASTASAASDTSGATAASAAPTATDSTAAAAASAPSGSAGAPSAGSEAPGPKAAEAKAGEAKTAGEPKSAGEAKTVATPKAAAAPATKESSFVAAMAGGAAPAAAGASEQPFNMGEAKARLAAAASAAQGCKKPDGPTGTGRVVVLFSPTGAALSVTISGPPFEGTPTGNCVAGRFRAVRVPAFGGSAFSVSKSFSVN